MEAPQRERNEHGLIIRKSLIFTVVKAHDFGIGVYDCEHQWEPLADFKYGQKDYYYKSRCTKCGRTTEYSPRTLARKADWIARRKLGPLFQSGAARPKGTTSGDSILRKKLY